MANGNISPQALMELMNRQKQLTTQRQQLQTAPVSRGIREEGQSWGQFFKNPTQDQQSAALQAGLALLSSNTGQRSLGANLGSALAGGLGQLHSARQERKANRLAGLESEQKGLQQEYTNMLGLMKEQRMAGAGESEYWADPNDPTKVFRFIRDQRGQARMGPNAGGPVVDPAKMGLVPYRAPAVSVNVGGESAVPKDIQKEREEMGKKRAQWYSDINDAANAAPDNLARIQQFRANLESAPTGPMANVAATAGATISHIAHRFNLDVPENIANGTASLEQIKAFTQDFVRPRMQATKGAISDREMDMFIKSVPGLLNSKEGNLRLMDFMEGMERANLERQQFVDAYLEADPSRGLKAAQSAWNNYRMDFQKFNEQGPIQSNYGHWQSYLQNGEFSAQGPDGRPISMSDLKETARKHGETVGEVLQNLQRQGR